MLWQTTIIPNRTLSSLYVILDIIFLLGFALYFIKTKRYIPLLVGLLGGLLYFIVDYGGFYLLLGTRKVVGANTFWFLLWLSMSYGFTNMVWMWLWFAELKNRLEYSLLIIVWWFSAAIISNGLSTHFSTITIERGTGGYHWIMAVFLFVGYAFLILKNLSTKDEEKKYPILDILAIGLLVQFAWETVLFITGIRNAGIRTLIVNSLMETNLGAPYMYLIYKTINKN
ncbi:MAG: hypothetical protein P1P64_00065 [Treponemataceae bacterium]